MSCPDVVELLANLDFLVEGPKTRSLQDEDYDEYTYELLGQLSKSLGSRYTVEQIRKQLWTEFQPGYEFPQHNIDLLFLHGSSEIRTLSPELKSLIKEQLRTIRLQKALHAPRCRRSLARVEKHRGHHRNSGPARPSAKFNTGKSRTNAVKKDVSLEKSTYPKARQSTTSTPKPQTVQSIVIPARTKTDHNSYHSPFSSPPTREPTTTVPFSGEKLAMQSTSVAHTARSMNEKIDRRSHYMTRSPRSLAMSTEIDDMDMISAMVHYKRRCEEAEHKCEDLKKERRQMESLRYVPEDVSNVLQQNIRQISNLKKQLDDRANLERYLYIGNFPDETLNAQQFISRFQMMKDQIPTILVLNDADKLSIKHLYGESTDLDGLLSIIFGTDGLGGFQKMADSLPALTLYDLVQALTGAAIHSWIFGSEYRIHSLKDSPLLQKYRDHIATLCGYESLCNLDIAVHRSIVDEQSFRDVIVRNMSETYTTRLLHALQPLFQQPLERNATRKLKSSLDRVLSLAVQIRSDSLVGTEDYESVWPAIGSTYSQNEMETKHAGSVAIANVVRLSLCPGLRAYSKKKAMVEYHSLGNGGCSNVTPKYVIKALVLC
ncbi:hypothetical protein P153DRAFT_370595 [Dothidotthia symphoricarpi CBS 119687]|uniref:Uncharacterized protein n=1 Tax=Dothidotthia symphoricarpi CBS 119687 TaxID=1392245 RepID=A0A6A5ZZG5_9PLEO|nr:uncharacterized protein P153DRAFT_370595 [Dothidotthia symphoricarpi CBS 119687]KAF2124676.1 hypothetical protein P153DRAFT_370595 [Dothidotthia symphoricarpi CBS 119687]